MTVLAALQADYRKALGAANRGPVTPAELIGWRDDAHQVLRQALDSTNLGRAFAADRLSDAQRRRLLGRIVVNARKELRQNVELLRAGDLSLGRWAQFMRRGVGAHHLAAGLVGLGTASPDPAQVAAIRPSLDRQLGFLDRFRDQVRSGQQLLDGTATARAGMYGNASWGTGMNARLAAAQVRGDTEGLRVLGAAEEHCDPCRVLAAAGWMPLEMVTPIGLTVCRGNCRCSILTR